MSKAMTYSPEVRERAVRMVFEHQKDHTWQWATIASIAGKIGCTAQTLCNEVRQAECDQGRREGLSTSEREKMKSLERECGSCGRPTRSCARHQRIHHSDRGVQYVSIRYSERLVEARIEPSVGSVGDWYDNALAETINGLYKADVIHRRSWRNREQMELATLDWVHWYNDKRLLGPIGYVPPAEAEAAYDRQQIRQAEAA